ncbi:hypothetical protein E5288_WYG020283 [Bos mutus]|uniref:Uncharacterized protein n=1 Tax=Bos mutus TaxID=72004 RepID=A0A6B0S3G4_9CETA|nr:hypothetical protein [Bos mutus]
MLFLSANLRRVFLLIIDTCKAGMLKKEQVRGMIRDKKRKKFCRVDILVRSADMLLSKSTQGVLFYSLSRVTCGDFHVTWKNISVLCFSLQFMIGQGIKSMSHKCPKATRSKADSTKRGNGSFGAQSYGAALAEQV